MPNLYDVGLAKKATDALLQKIEAEASREQNPRDLLRLAEALAWVMDPSQTHGGSNATAPS